jgi:hypothetical protein
MRREPLTGNMGENFGSRKPVHETTKAMRSVSDDYADSRASNWLTVPACHSPAPLGVGMPRSLSPAVRWPAGCEPYRRGGLSERVTTYKRFISLY